MDARDLLHLAWVIPALPALGAVVLLLVGRRIGEPRAGWLATAMMGLSFVASVVAFFALRSLPGEARVDFAENVSQGYTWMKVGGLTVDFRFLVDPLSSTMTLFITGVGTLIHAYAIGYMHGDPRFSRFFAYLNLFAASMLVLVLGSGFVTTFMGWEGVGLCSYLLISFWFERESAAVAGKKAFVTNRIGDVGFLLAMFLIFRNLGSLGYGSLEGAVDLPGSTVTAIALLLFVGAVGKSAQFPLHIWLPDAMEGPTPVSALIHAATMVTAGVYLVARAHPFFEASAHAGTVVAWVGAFTAIFAATTAIVQNDIKRVLAWSTVSQLGYMFLAAGIGAYTAAIFLMVVHAFFKALLFLGAGSVIHGLHEEQDMRRMGRLRALMPITAGTFIVGWLAIAGVVPLSGFWAKDEVLAQAWFRGEYALWAVGLVGALFTAFYMTRQVILVFFGNDRRDHEVHAHESPWIMLAPLGVLAGLSAIGGLLNLPFTNAGLDFLHHWLEPVFEGVPEPHASSFAQGFVLSTVALTVAVAGILVAFSIYRRGLPDPERDPVVERLGPLSRVLANAYFVDAGIARLVAGPLSAFARFLAGPVDRDVIDGTVNGFGETTTRLSGAVRRLQTGLVRNYALAVVLGAVLILLYVVARASF
ncbi:MAG: NADH-quinone oxidoreductase subunit L [Actinomycetota bacterium]